MRLTTLHACALLVLATLALGACSKKDDAKPADAAPAMAVTVVPARAQEIPREIRVSGPVAAREEMQLGVEVSGLRVTGLYVDVGDFVRRGQVLLDLDARSLQSELEQAQASYREAQAAASLAQANLRRAEPLVAQKYISAGQVDELRAARDQANARVATVRAQLDAARLRRSYAELRAPDDGIVSRRAVQPGQIVASGTELIGLIRDGRLEWRADLADTELAAVNVGDAVMVRAPDGHDVEGEVRAVPPGVDPATRTGTVYVDLPEPEGLRTGAYLPGRILVGNAQALVVPATAIVQRDGNPYVFTVDAKGVAHRVRVRTGTTSNGVVEILDGLASSAQVVDQGAGFLGDGDKVRVVPAVTTTSATPVATAPSTTPARAASESDAAP
ncbi:efflux RND transporter periplasmic adaptor subunit [Lysobacter sp. TY2-98]|uniref:efflux RND transporter periplasmic adaptor subunit n=1 Tax=Lysobacter sp. TY2-98 TaxID=2290922 RepID=UPI000E2076B5|nr:efflux RND transporter periplasmic adaptor subunit [Lysobacter sp. TY2-98]AXK73222.1 efflux RND transporter periplasmic adaptor subunit [Lysobacter sp. TY2-98]